MTTPDHPSPSHSGTPGTPVLSFRGAAVDPLWRDLTLDVAPGELIAILGTNGVGKSTLLHTILGTRRLTAGSVDVRGRVGVIPQQRLFDPNLPIRARDMVGLALGHGMLRHRRPSPALIDAALAEVGATGLAHRRVGELSGGQQQLIRQAQALAGDPQLLLCDEPLLSLDSRAQQRTVDLLDRYRREHHTAILFVTHSINPILELTDRVLYLTPNGHRIGTVDEVMTSESLSELYRTDVTVARVAGRLVVL